jgi:predicted Holliday junction resolvase-like endonuclease
MLIVTILLFAALVGAVYFIVKQQESSNKKFAEQKRQDDARYEQYKAQSMRGIRNQVTGNTVEQLAPWCPGFPANPETDVFQAVFGVFDYIIYRNIDVPDADVEIVFLDVKSGNARANLRQRRCMEAINNGRISAMTYTPYLPVAAIPKPSSALEIAPTVETPLLLTDGVVYNRCANCNRKRVGNGMPRLAEFNGKTGWLCNICRMSCKPQAVASLE